MPSLATLVARGFYVLACYRLAGYFLDSLLPAIKAEWREQQEFKAYRKRWQD